MHKHTLLLLAIMLWPAILPAQSGNWVEDSLAIYHKKIQQALGQQQFEEVNSYYNHLSKEGSKTLDPLIFESFYHATKNDLIKKRPELLGNIYNCLGNLEFYRTNMAEAKNAFLLAMEQFRLADMRREMAGMAMNLGVILEKTSAFDSAIHSYEKALPIFEEMKDTSSIASCLENIGIVFHYKGNHITALTYLDKTDSVLQTNTPPTSGRWTNLWYNKSIVFTSLGNYDQALYFAIKGLKQSENLKNDRRINTGYVMLEEIYEKLHDDKNRLKYIFLAKEFAEKTNNRVRLSELYYSLAGYYLEKNNLDSASYFVQSGLDYYTENHYLEGLSRGYVLKGKINYRKENYRQAIDDFQVAIENLASSSSMMVLTETYHNVGSSYMKLKEYGMATDYLLQALELRMGTGDIASLGELYQSLSECSKEQGDYSQAYEYLSKFKQYEDSVFNETKSKQIAEIQTQYETEKKDQAIAGLESEREIQQLKNKQQANQIYLSLAGLALLLVLAFVFYNRARLRQKTNVMLEAKNNEIAKQNKEKEILLKEIHHRVKNNLQVISSLLSMQTRGLTDSKIVDAMKESQSRVKTMALIHEKLYQYDDLSRVNMKEYMKQLSDFLAQTYRTEKDINVIIEVEDINLDIDTAVPLGLITNELLSNALKYAFQDMEQGEIKIVLNHQKTNGYQLIVSDTGKGLSKDLDIKKSTSLGLRLVHTLTRQINGDLSIQSQPGTTFSIEFQEESALVA